jgi:hypothetical protein
MTWSKRATSTTTQHTHVVVFGRRVAGCPRCEELANGAAPIRWARREDARGEASRQYALHRESCPICNGSQFGICTYGEW